MVHIFNHFFLNLQLGTITVSEDELDKQNVKAMQEIINDNLFIIVFDSGYPSIELVHLKKITLNICLNYHQMAIKMSVNVLEVMMNL